MYNSYDNVFHFLAIEKFADIHVVEDSGKLSILCISPLSTFFENGDFSVFLSQPWGSVFMHVSMYL